MHANVHGADRNEWRLPPDETLQVADPKAKKAEVGDEEVSTRRRTDIMSGLQMKDTLAYALLYDLN